MKTIIKREREERKTLFELNNALGVSLGMGMSKYGEITDEEQ